MEDETVGEVHYGHVNLRKTEGAMTVRAIEMRMFIVDVVFTFAVVGTDIVFQGTTAVIHGMNESVNQKECQ